MHTKKLLLACLLSCLFFAPVTARADYRVTDAQMEELSEIYTTLSKQSTEQQELLNEQKTQIETLSKQLKTSSEEISSSKNQLEQAQKQLTDLENSWKKYEDKNKQTESRLQRQRNTWAVIAVAFICISLAK